MQDLELHVLMFSSNVAHGMYQAMKVLAPGIRKISFNGDISLEVIENVLKEMRPEYLRGLKIHSDAHFENWKFVTKFKELRDLSLFVLGGAELNEFNDYLPSL